MTILPIRSYCKSFDKTEDKGVPSMDLKLLEALTKGGGGDWEEVKSMLGCIITHHCDKGTCWIWMAKFL
jgi:hypothetical protein